MEKPNGEPEQIFLKDLATDYYRLQFLVETGSEMLKKVLALLAPRIIAASSILGSTCRKLFDPVSTPIESVRNTMAIMMISAVPVSIIGFVLKATT